VVVGNVEESTALGRGVRYRAIYERTLLEAPGELDSIAKSVAKASTASARCASV
jgi:hypothetical protein